jgi:recombinational DNA repair protein RecR
MIDKHDNTQGDRLAFATDKSFKCSQCGNMYPVGMSECDICGNHCSESTCMVLDSSREDF